MASSVSSERAFSSAGITISKRRNRLNFDIVEALQSLKSAICHNFLARPAEPSKSLEEELAEEEAADGTSTPGANDNAVKEADLPFIIVLESDSESELGSGSDSD